MLYISVVSRGGSWNDSGIFCREASEVTDDESCLRVAEKTKLSILSLHDIVVIQVFFLVDQGFQPRMPDLLTDPTSAQRTECYYHS